MTLNAPPGIGYREGINKPMTQNEAWQQVLDRLKASFDPKKLYILDNVIRPLDVSVSGNKLILTSADMTATRMLKLRWYTLISDIVRDVFGRNYETYIVTSGDPLPPEASAGEGGALRNGQLNPKYTFDTFVVGESNRFAHAASLAVAEVPSEAYNPLFLYGGVGLGKTHLMNAIGHYILADNPACNLLYITSETFTNEVINAIQKKTNNQLREKLRGVDVLMIDDIQFIAGKTSTQEEFFHTFNHLHGSGKQIVISSDRPPKDIPTLEERLRSRFEWGLIADIQKPDYETRVAILRKKASSEYIEVPDNVLNLIAEKMDSNIRELEGMLTRVNAKATLDNIPITLDLAQQELSKLVGVRDTKRITPESIMQTVADYYHVDKSDMLSQRRNREIALPRQVAMFLIREHTSLSTTRIGDLFGGRDHTTVMHGCEKIAQASRSNPQMAGTLDALRTTIRER